METELTTYIILIVIAAIIMVFFTIRKKIKTVILLAIIIILLLIRTGSLKMAIDLAKQNAEETEKTLENDETEDQQENSINLPKLDFLPEANYYKKSEREEEESE